MSTVSRYFQGIIQNKIAHPEWRYGQTLFNTLYEQHPEAANAIRGTELDPFHTNDQAVIDRFIEYVLECFREGKVVR